jgi:serine/threonine-protein kinase HSL1 (negative regulator of Swe1 kinase)
LPPPPARSESVKMELMEARLQAELRKKFGGDESPSHLDRMVSHIDRLIQPSSPLNTQTDRRSLSAPVDNKAITSVRPLPSIHEARKEEESPRLPTDYDQFMDHYQRKEAKTSRNASAPEPRKSARDYAGDRFTRTDTNMKDTIRVVDPSSPGSPVKVPAPLTIRKKSSHGGSSTPLGSLNGTTLGNNSNPSRHRQSVLDCRQNQAFGSKLDIGSDLGRIEEALHDDSFANDSNSGTIVKKKSTWFKRNSKTGEDQDWKISVGGVNTIPSQSCSNDTMQQRQEAPLLFAPKKRGFSLGRLFRKRPSKTDMTLGGKYTTRPL